MSRATGIDLVISGRDESAPIFAAFEDRLRNVESSVSTMGARISSDFTRKIGGAFVGAFGVQTIDRALREFSAKVKEGADGSEAAIAFADTFANALKSVPIAGVVGEWIGELFDFGGDLLNERAQEASRKAAERLQRTNEQIEGMLRKLRQDTLSEEERRRQEFEQQAAPLLKGLEGTGEMQRVKETLAREFEAQQQRLRAKEAEKRQQEEALELERQRAEEQRRLDQERQEREREEQKAAQERERAEQERINRLEQLRRAEERLAGAVDRGTVSERTLMFQNDRRAEASGPSPGAAAAASPFGARTLQVQERTSETLKSIETYQRGTLEALRELAERMPELQVI